MALLKGTLFDSLCGMFPSASHLTTSVRVLYIAKLLFCVFKKKERKEDTERFSPFRCENDIFNLRHFDSCQIDFC